MYSSTGMEEVGGGDVIWDEHNHSARASLSASTPPSALDHDQATTADDVQPDVSPDPELEDLPYTSSAVPKTQSTTPAAAWVLTTLLLLSVLQKTYSASIIGEIAAHVVQEQYIKKTCMAHL